MYIKTKKLNEKGIGLIETIAALGVAVIVITSLVSLSVFTLRSSTRSKLLLQGSKLASNELELVRTYRDTRTSWAQFLTGVTNCTSATPPTSYCNITTSGTSINVNQGQKVSGTAVNAINVGFYVTKINGQPIQSTDNIVRVTVRTSWNIGGQVQYSYIYTDLSNWRNQ
jgi:Tfp pilus assembly protein PilV